MLLFSTYWHLELLMAFQKMYRLPLPPFPLELACMWSHCVSDALFRTVAASLRAYLVLYLMYICYDLFSN